MNDIMLNIKDLTYSFNDVVSDPQIVKLYKSNDSVYAYYKSHYFELLDYSLGHHNSTYGYNSYEILILGDTDILEPILNSIDYEYVSSEQIQYFDVVYEKVFGLYFILRKCSLSPNFSYNLYCKEMIQILTKSFVNHPLYVENARWETILVLTTKKTSKIMLPIVPDVIEVNKKDVDVLPAYVVFAIEIVSKMMDFSAKAADIVFESRVLIDILNLVKKFCSCTELFKSFHKFIESFLKYTKKITQKMLQILLQFILDFAKTRENKVLAPFCIGFLELLIDAGERNKKILKAINHCEGCREFINGEYVEYKKIVDANYGFDMELTDEQN